ncbi:MAG: 4-(cytidine 5'-diphospho)-2-C-methyl-D-erythritol kinase [Candidatus Margulisiibacteriota bacterium]
MLRIKAFAKINLSLKILGKRPDGFHELSSIMQSVSLFDELTLSPSINSIELSTNNSKLTNDARNLCYKAVEEFNKAMNLGSDRKKNRLGVKIELEKNIPLAAGLAGGSADAAAVLFGLNELNGNPFSIEKLMEIGARIGSDIPFCLVGGNCRVEGRGERVTRNQLPETGNNYVLVVPDIEVSTKWSYAHWNTINFDSETTNNDLEPIAIANHPVIQEIKNKLVSLGCSYSQMSGSGPSVFGVIDDVERGGMIAAEMKKEFSRSYFVKPVGRGVVIE